MNLIEAVILGLIQGVTEFLPISSSGHLELGKYLFGLDPEANFYFSVAAHGGTVMSTIFIFRKDILSLTRGFFRFRWNDETIYVFKIFVSMIPAAIAGFFILDIENFFFRGNMILLGFNFFLTATLLLLTLFIRPKERPIGFWDALIIGIAQVIAIMPGVSRSGSTIATGMMLGNRKSELARFSFLMVLIPVIGANLFGLHIGNTSGGGASISVIAAGFITAIISGYFACRWMINLVRNGNLAWFALYCVLAGIFSVLLGLHVI
jgi:undecaprenyl-diphosphatase